jgi:predicted DNA-binding protein (UPF0251 family)/predicted Fe-Mo cluster-binding NifX family protein
MPRPKFPRKVGFLPGVKYFKPANSKLSELKEVVLGHDEIEAVRLKNLQGLSQEEAAEEMNVSQPTFHRLLSSAYTKMTDAIVNGKALRIEGGNISLPEAHPPEAGTSEARSGKRLGGRRRPGKERTEAPGATKIAITSIDGTMEGMVDERFGRARKIIVYDLSTGESEILDNQGQENPGQGAGTRVVERLLSLGAHVVITGHLGPNAFAALEAAKVEAYSAVNTSVRDALRRFREGRLEMLAGPDVRGHW